MPQLFSCNMSTKRLKILIGSYACDPSYGSEPGMGWNFVYHLSRYHDVHAIVEEHEFKEKLLQYSREHPERVKNIRFHFVPRVHHATLRKIWPPSYYWFYRKWQKKAYRLARQLDAQEHFDAVYQVTISGFREPGFLWKLGKPFVWGPLGGFTDTPWCLLRCLGLYGALYFGVRNIINYFQKRWGFSARAASAHAHTILTSTTKAVEEIRRFWKKDAVLMNEVGFEPDHEPLPPSSHRPGAPLRLCWAGEHIPRKALDLLLNALPLCREKMELHVLSRGPRMEAWKALARRLGLENNVIFHGFVPREEAFRIMSSSHVFCITSIREDTSTVVFEAFRYGLPIIALDHCGFSTVIDKTSGIKIPIRSHDQVIADYAKHLDFLASHEEERLRLSQGASARCRQFTWESKMQVLNSIFEEATS